MCAKCGTLGVSLSSKLMSLKTWPILNVRTRSGERPRTLTTRSTSLVGLVEEKARCWRWVALSSGGGLILEGASGSQRTSVGFTVSNLAPVGSAYRELQVSNSIARRMTSHDPRSGCRSMPGLQEYPHSPRALGKDRRGHRDCFPCGVREICELFLSTHPIS